MPRPPHPRPTRRHADRLIAGLVVLLVACRALPDAPDARLYCEDVPPPAAFGQSVAIAACVADLTRDPLNCGACGRVCGAVNGVARCESGTCGFTCSPGFGDCDANVANGCEASLGTDLEHCGSCTAVCGAANASPVCSAGACALRCSPGHDDCNALPADGCEQDVGSDRLNCGACGVVCPVRCSSNACAGVTELALGAAHTCARLSDGARSCWGRNARSELDLPAGGDRTTPQPVPARLGTRFALGDGVSCWITATGGVQCRGSNASGTLGDGTTNDALGTPVDVTLPGAANQLALFGAHACALMASTEVFCWGSDAAGQVGDGQPPAAAVPTPAPVVAINAVTQVAVGASHSCALALGGKIYCWGSNELGELGRGAVSPGESTPAFVQTGAGDLVGAVRVAAGGSFTCAIVGGGGVKCWGKNANGQLGDTTTVNRTLPVDVAITGATELALGVEHACARLGDGTVRCWGLGASGQTGDGSGTTVNASPVAVRDLTSAASLAANGNRTCARLADARLLCWGEDTSGSLGTGAGGNVLVPTAPSW